MKPAWRVFLGAGLALTLAVLLAMAAALQDQPAVPAPVETRLDDVARAMALLRHHDPRRRPPGHLGAAWLSERDLQVLAGHGTRRWLGADSHVRLVRGGALLQLSLAAPANPFGRWLNVELEFAETAALPELGRLRVGRLPLPAWLARLALPWAARRAGLQAELALAAEVLQAVHFLPQQLHLTYRWQPGSAQRMVAGLIAPAELQRLRAYAEHLHRLTTQVHAGWELQLPQLLLPMFELARTRTAQGGDAAAENRAVLFALALFVNGRGLERVLPAAQQWPRPLPKRVLAGGREDVPQHFLVSAALAAEAGGQLSRLVGLYKEVSDARQGSGFSFSDLAADRAGTRFGELAVQDPLGLQARLAASTSEGDFIPAAADLPDQLPEAEFRRRFGGVDHPGYTAMMSEIDRRVAALTLFR